MKSTSSHDEKRGHMGRKPKEETERTVAGSMRLDYDIHEALVKSAKSNRSSVNRELNRLLAVALKHEKKLTG